MSCQIKDFRSIVASMINVSRAAKGKITDFSVGSVARTIMEAPAIEIEELYLQMLLGLQEAIPTAVFTSFNFDRLAAIAASGTVQFTCESSASAIVVPAGTRVKSESSTYEYATQVDAVIPASSTYVDALVSCTSSGVATNCAAGTLATLVTPVSGITSATNSLAFTNGADAESDLERKSRFMAYVSTLSRGTGAALRYGASQAHVLDATGTIIESAQHISVVEPYLADSAQPVGLVNVYVHNGTGATSAGLISQVQQTVDGYANADGTLVPGWKAAGVKVDVYAASEVSVAVTGVITMQTGYLKPAALVLAAAAVSEYIKSLGIGSSAIKSEIVSLIMSVDGVYNVVLSAPAADVDLTGTQKAMPSTITLS